MTAGRPKAGLGSSTRGQTKAPATMPTAPQVSTVQRTRAEMRRLSGTGTGAILDRPRQAHQTTIASPTADEPYCSARKSGSTPSTGAASHSPHSAGPVEWVKESHMTWVDEPISPPATTAGTRRARLGQAGRSVAEIGTAACRDRGNG